MRTKIRILWHCKDKLIVSARQSAVRPRFFAEFDAAHSEEPSSAHFETEFPFFGFSFFFASAALCHVCLEQLV